MNKTSINNIPGMGEEYYCDRDSATATGHYLTDFEWKFISKCLLRDRFRKLRILDFGGGSGRFAIPLFNKGMEVIVEEVDDLPLKLLHQKNPAIPAILLDPGSRSFPFNDSCADCILCIEVPDLTESEWFYKEAQRILKRDGLLIFTTHNRCSYKGFYKKTLLREDMSSIDWHKTHYRSTFRQVKDLLRHAGFKLTAALGFHWIPVSRASNNRYIPLYTILEKVFYLNAIKTLSPWVIAMAKKL